MREREREKMDYIFQCKSVQNIKVKLNERALSKIKR